jgi:AraC-like DNA-binding protein
LSDCLAGLSSGSPAVRFDHASQTVTAIACRRGFHSQSRFAAAYRQAYGVTPRHSLNQE